MAHMVTPAPSLRVLRPDVALSLDNAYLKMMAKRPEDRPASMTEVIALLEESKNALDRGSGALSLPPRDKFGLMIFDEQPVKQAGPARTKGDPPFFVQPEPRADPGFDPDASVYDLVMDFHLETEPACFVPAPEAVAAEIQPEGGPRATGLRAATFGALIFLLTLGATVALAVFAINSPWLIDLAKPKTVTLPKKGNAPNGGNVREAAGAPAKLPTKLPQPPRANDSPPGQDRSAASSPPAGTMSATVASPETAATAKPRAREIAGWGVVVDPDGDCRIDGNQSALSITVPGTLHDLNADIGLYNAPRVLREVVGDFDIQVKVMGDFRPGASSNRARGLPFNGAGIVVFADGDKFIRLERGVIFDNGSFNSVAIFEHHEGGSSVTDQNGPLDSGTAYLRLSRRGGRLIGSTSDDGKLWRQLTPMDIDLPARLGVGCDAINSSSASFTVRFEGLSFKTADTGSARR
jgi:regulation of enolase protein 1 (concanavalin A-like superfamily)